MKKIIFESLKEYMSSSELESKDQILNNRSLKFMEAELYDTPFVRNNIEKLIGDKRQMYWVFWEGDLDDYEREISIWLNNELDLTQIGEEVEMCENCDSSGSGMDWGILNLYKSNKGGFFINHFDNAHASAWWVDQKAAYEIIEKFPEAFTRDYAKS